MKRRNFIQAGVLSYLALPALAANQIQGEPFLTVGPYSDDQLKAYIFFSYDCIFCRQNHQALERWRTTVPAPIQVERVPMVYIGNVNQAMAFIAVRSKFPNRLAEFDEAAFRLIQDQGMSVEDPNTFTRAAKESGIPGADLLAAIRSTDVRDRTMKAGKTIVRYRVDITPSIAIGGQQVINPGFTRGDYATFFQLANGLVSQILLKG